MKKPQGKTARMQLLPDTSPEASINTLVEKYPGGIYHGYYNTTRAAKLSLDAIRELLKTTHNSKEEFRKLLSNNEAFLRLVAEKNDKLISNWFRNLAQANTERTNLALRLEREKANKEAKKAAQAQRRERDKEARRMQAIKDREARRRQAEKAKARAKNKAMLWKELDLSAQQKQIFRKLAS